MDYTDLPLEADDPRLCVRIHPSARIGADSVARVPHGARGPFTIELAAGVTVGQRVVFDFTEPVVGSATTPRMPSRMEHPSVTVDSFAVIGHDTVLTANVYVPAGTRVPARVTLDRAVPKTAAFCVVNADLKTGTTLVTANAEPIRELLQAYLGQRRPSADLDAVRTCVAMGHYDEALLRALFDGDPRMAREMLDHLEQATRRASTDIQYHLPFLAALARRGGSVLECGIREGVSSVAFVKGLVDTAGLDACYTGVDIDCFALTNANVVLLKGLASRAAGIEMELHHASSLQFPLPEQRFSVVFIDTLHVYGLLLRELRRLAPLLTEDGVFVLHDTESDGVDGEIVRLTNDAAPREAFLNEMMRHNPEIPDRAEFLRGLLPAIRDFCAEDPAFRVLYQSAKSSGLTVIGRASSETFVREALNDAYGGGGGLSA